MSIRNSSSITWVKLLLLLISCTLSFASELNPDSLRKLDFKQNLNSQVDLDLPFVDDAGTPVHLRDYFGDKPAILMMGYYECPMLCNLVLNGLVQGMSEINAGNLKQLSIIFVSIDPSETPQLAAAKKKTYLERYGSLHPGEEWHFLTGKAPDIAKLAASIGFNYQYDPSIKQFAHPSGIVILTPSGLISQYILGIKYNPALLQQAIQTAKEKKIGSRASDFLLLCFFYQPLTGKYSATIMIIIRGLAILVMATLTVYIARSLRSHRPPETTPNTSSPDEISSSS
ncbi:MAG: SCO family protein [Verrucomicrobiota bacterium]